MQVTHPCSCIPIEMRPKGCEKLLPELHFACFVFGKGTDLCATREGSKLRGRVNTGVPTTGLTCHLLLPGCSHSWPRAFPMPAGLQAPPATSHHHPWSQQCGASAAPSSRPGPGLPARGSGGSRWWGASGMQVGQAWGRQRAETRLSTGCARPCPAASQHKSCLQLTRLQQPLVTPGTVSTAQAVKRP